MKITRVKIEKDCHEDKSLAVFSIVFDDELRVNSVKLYKTTDYYLVMPSKQDIYQRVKELNSEEVRVPDKTEKNKSFEEFFFPLDSTLYKKMLNILVSCYEKHKKLGTISFRF